jgi:hypothetical protein
VVTVTFRPDGTSDISQNILPLPGYSQYDDAGHGARVGYGRLVRELQLGQQLYRSGELIKQQFRDKSADEMRELLSARGESREGAFPYEAPNVLLDLLSANRTDPILSSMAFFAWRRYFAARTESEPDWGMTLLREIADNLHRSYGALPDSHLIAGLAYPEQRDFEFGYLLEEGTVPVLAEGAHILATYAGEAGREHSAIAGFALEMSLRHVWTTTFSTPTVAQLSSERGPAGRSEEGEIGVAREESAEPGYYFVEATPSTPWLSFDSVRTEPEAAGATATASGEAEPVATESSRPASPSAATVVDAGTGEARGTEAVSGTMDASADNDEGAAQGTAAAVE